MLFLRYLFIPTKYKLILGKTVIPFQVETGDEEFDQKFHELLETNLVQNGLQNLLGRALGFKPTDVSFNLCSKFMTLKIKFRNKKRLSQQLKYPRPRLRKL